MSERKGGGDSISALIGTMVAIVVGANLIPAIMESVQQVKNGGVPVATNITQQLVYNPKLFSTPIDPTWALVILCLLMLGVASVWIYTLYLKAKSQGAKV